jgi:hypothetical protein
VRERALRRARTHSGRVPWSLLAVLAATVLATLGLFVTSSLATPSAGGATEKGAAVSELSTSAAAASPAGTGQPDPVTDLSAPVTSADSDPSPAGSDLDPPSDGKALAALALFVLVLWGVGRGRRAAADALSGSYIGAVDHVPRAGLEGQLCPDAQSSGSPLPPSVEPAGSRPTSRRAGADRSLRPYGPVPCGLFARPSPGGRRGRWTRDHQRRPGDRLCRRLPRLPPQGGLPVALQDVAHP